LQGLVDASEYQTIKILKTGTSTELQTYKINPDGSFYIILKAGTYDFSFEGLKTKKLSSIDVSQKVEVKF
jgi:hypothetical protein